jgi:hypothetical protein
LDDEELEDDHEQEEALENPPATRFDDQQHVDEEQLGEDDFCMDAVAEEGEELYNMEWDEPQLRQVCCSVHLVHISLLRTIQDSLSILTMMMTT